MNARREEILLLSDLHLGAGRPGLDAPDPFTDDAALSALLGHLATRPDSEDVALRVVLLGDIVDLVLVGAAEAFGDRSPAAARRDLDAIAAAHKGVFAALGDLCATDGVVVDVVPGNHDMELAAHAVIAHLRSLVAGAAGRPPSEVRMRMAPWIVHVPGLLHAEHGQQHHDLSRFPDLPAVSAAGGAALRTLPPAAHIDALLGLRLARAGPSRLAAGAARIAPRLATAAWALGRRQAPSGQHGGLPTALLEELDRATATGAWDVARRLARRQLGGRRTDAALDLRSAAARTHAILTRHGHTVPFVVFGHTHVPLDEPVGAGGRHLNPGTWSNVGPGAGGRTVIRIARGREHPRASLERWDPERGALAAL